MCRNRCVRATLPTSGSPNMSEPLRVCHTSGSPMTPEHSLLLPLGCNIGDGDRGEV